MSTQVELSEMDATRGEKFLAFVLAVFLLVGGLWFYFQPLDRDEPDSFSDVGAQPAAIQKYESAQSDLRGAARRRAAARQDLEVAREDYRTAIDAGRPAGALEGDYRAAQRRYERATTRTDALRTRVRELRPAAQRATDKFRAAEDAASKRAEKAHDKSERETFAMRLAWILICLGAAFWLFNRQRRAASRYLPIGMAAVGAATAQALVMAGDYTTDYVDFGEAGPLLISVTGVAFSVAAFVGLQRYLVRRLPRRRVRRRECPFCGFPVGANDRCEGCGRAVVAPCATCEKPRRVGTPFCGACGSA